MAFKYDGREFKTHAELTAFLDGLTLGAGARSGAKPASAPRGDGKVERLDDEPKLDAREAMVKRNAELAKPAPATPTGSRPAPREDERPGEDARERFLRRAREAHKRPGAE
jgi:hypothetical protein